MSVMMVAMASSVNSTWRGPMSNVGLFLPRSRGFGDDVLGLHGRGGIVVQPPLGRGTLNINRCIFPHIKTNLKIKNCDGVFKLVNTRE